MTTKTELLFMHFLVKHGVATVFADNVNGKFKNYLRVTNSRLLIAEAFSWHLVNYPGQTKHGTVENLRSWTRLHGKWIEELNKQTS